MDNRFYILKDKKPIQTDLHTWGKFFQTQNRTVKKDVLKMDKENTITVSTVFIGMNHQYNDSGNPPLIFETMIFGGEHHGYQDRYSTWEEAEKGHQDAINLINENRENQN